MVPIGNGILGLAIFLNVIGSIIIICLAYNGDSFRKLEEIPARSFHKFNLRGSKLKNNEIYFSPKSMDNFDMNNINKNISKERSIRALSVDLSQTEKGVILYVIGGISLYFTINLMLSINNSDEESSSRSSSEYNSHSNRNDFFSNLNCEGSGNDGGEGGAIILVIVLCIVLIALFYLIQKTMGKKMQLIVL